MKNTCDTTANRYNDFGSTVSLTALLPHRPILTSPLHWGYFFVVAAIANKYKYSCKVATEVDMKNWPATEVALFDTEKLIPYARNSRVHSEEQVAQIAASIQEWGFTVPILVDEENTLIAGHGRLLAAQKLDLPQVPVMVARDWSDAQKRAYVIADNKLTENSTWDEELLKVEIKQLEFDDFDIGKLGFGLDEMADLFLDKDFGDTDAFDEWQDMPEYDNEDVNYYRSFKIHFNNQEDLDEFLEKTGLQITEKTRSTVYPEQEKADLDAYRVNGTDDAA